MLPRGHRRVTPMWRSARGGRPARSCYAEFGQLRECPRNRPRLPIQTQGGFGGGALSPGSVQRGRARAKVGLCRANPSCYGAAARLRGSVRAAASRSAATATVLAAIAARSSAAAAETVIRFCNSNASRSRRGRFGKAARRECGIRRDEGRPIGWRRYLAAPRGDARKRRLSRIDQQRLTAIPPV